MARIGIIAYGSLIQMPGSELNPCIVERISIDTPFPVEFARLSKARGNGPTVVPHKSGSPVRAQVLVLREGVELTQARNMLWRRETHQHDLSQACPAPRSKRSVLLQDIPGFLQLDHVLYTDFPDTGKIPNPDATSLAKFAIESVKNAPKEMDGISYLIGLLDSGVTTRLTPQYRDEILRLTGATDLHQALAVTATTTTS